MVTSRAGDLPSGRPEESFGPSNETEATMVDDLLQFEQHTKLVLDSMPSPTMTVVESDRTIGVAPISSSPSAPISGVALKDGEKSSSSSLSLWQGRAIVIGAAAIYGTNFAAIKLLDPVIPLAASAAIRFTLAATAVTAAVTWSQSRRRTGQVRALSSEPWWMGGEVGAWYCVGYLCQAWGLHFVDASKVRHFSRSFDVFECQFTL
jgi:hypothetical protein